LDKVPAEVRQRYEKLQQNDLPAVISAHESDVDNENDSTDEDDDEADIQSLNQVSTQPTNRVGNFSFIKL